MIIFILALAVLTEILVAGVVFALGGGWLPALFIAQGAGCAAVLGAALVGIGLQHIHETAGAASAA